MEKVKLFDEEEFENICEKLNDACKEYGCEGAIIIAYPNGGAKMSHLNAELEFFSQHSILLNNLLGKDSNSDPGDSHPANTGGC